ncbi:ectoine/hydroxyectoine ABC transporter substrate-binding protein EhuB [Pararhizobium mangrovi]|uniref:ectoine/hydroxyectoine ABC transporter substrate-binding protein EhuB n=1 Tax=Pararhizobium mangrovi TaxID=2590452 RepID=UPI001F21E8A5|nr:ectoine/hydroxyectoine ABC transporter substrate-binding protein EhuB [Pararhizobium mangrovi]
MSKTVTAAAAVAMALVAGSASAASLQDIKDKGTVRIAIANEIPYGYMDMNGDAKGAGPDVAKHIMNELGIKNIKWVTTNFSSLIPGLQADRFDMVAAEMAVNPERCQKVIYSEPNSSYGEGLMVAKGNPKDITAYSDFKDGDKKVAIMAGADQLDMLQKLGVPQDNMVTLQSNSDAISTVANGRADAYAATGLTAAQLAKKSGKVQIVQNFKDPVVDGSEVRSWGAFAFNEDSKDLRDAVNKVLTKYKKTDAWAKDLESYGFTEADVKASSQKTTKELCSAKQS